ncbi:MAG: hypothetical protein E6J34_23305 [Chloroflexi bacterium]|nr:MAG: hypothetical protein E6J34_23305 [Chloroflexota bacterium]
MDTRLSPARAGMQRNITSLSQDVHLSVSLPLAYLAAPTGTLTDRVPAYALFTECFAALPAS